MKDTFSWGGGHRAPVPPCSAAPDTGSVLMIFKQYTLNGKRRVSNGKRHVIQRKQTRENVCGLCLNANSCNQRSHNLEKFPQIFAVSMGVVLGIMRILSMPFKILLFG